MEESQHTGQDQAPGGSAQVIQSAQRIEESTEKMRWKTLVEVAKVLSDDER